MTHNKIVSFIWGIADDVLRDMFKRGKLPADVRADLDLVKVEFAGEAGNAPSGCGFG